MYDLHLILAGIPGELARVGTLLGENGIGLEGGGLFTCGEVAHAHYLVVEGPEAEQILTAAGIHVAAVTRPLIRRLPQEKTGELGAIAAALAHSGITILTQYSDHAGRLILLTSNPTLAKGVTAGWADTDEG